MDTRGLIGEADFVGTGALIPRTGLIGKETLGGEAGLGSKDFLTGAEGWVLFLGKGFCWIFFLWQRRGDAFFTTTIGWFFFFAKTMGLAFLLTSGTTVFFLDCRGATFCGMTCFLAIDARCEGAVCFASPTDEQAIPTSRQRGISLAKVLAMRTADFDSLMIGRWICL